MRKYFYAPPKVLKKIYPNSIWTSLNNKVLITFDDGPTPQVTSEVLKQLDKYNIKSVFFCQGENLDGNSKIINEILERGHIIGAHGWHHNKITKMTNAKILDDISKMNEILSSQYNYEIKYFRAPYGRIYPYQASMLGKIGIKNVMWSLVTYDYESDYNKVKYAVDNYLSSNSIVVLHDSFSSHKILSKSIDYLYESIQKNNFEIGTPEECLK